MAAKRENFFVVIEGLDGSGKTEIGRRLAGILRETHNENVKLTFEPHDPSCSGLFIRQILVGKIKNLSPWTIALAFAANRADHCDREIQPFLNEGDKRIVICDRYRLSSLVYQTNSSLSMEEVYSLNIAVLRPDLTIYLDASNRTCYERMRRRLEDKQLFEKHLGETREKYQSAIKFSRERGETIVEVNADASVEKVLNKIIDALETYGPKWLAVQRPLLTKPIADVFSLNGDLGLTIAQVAESFSDYWNSGPILDEEDVADLLKALSDAVRAKMSVMSFNDLGSLFLDYLRGCGYRIVDRLPWTDLDAFELEYVMPPQVPQRGTALLLGEAQRYDLITKKIFALDQLSGYMFVFAPGSLQLISEYYEREPVRNGSGKVSLSPVTHEITRQDIAKAILAAAVARLYEEHLYTIRGNPELVRTISEAIDHMGLRPLWNVSVRELAAS